MGKEMVEKVSKIKNNEVAIQGNESKYLRYHKNILDEFRKVHNIIQNAEGPDAFYLISNAKKRLTISARQECEDLLKDLILNFNDRKIDEFCERVVSILSSLETTNYLYGYMFEIKDTKQYISEKITKLSAKRYKILEMELNKNKYKNLEDSKIKILFENIIYCNKLLTFANEIYTDNINALKINIIILEKIIKNATNIGIDNYTREIHLLKIQKYRALILEIENENFVDNAISHRVYSNNAIFENKNRTVVSEKTLKTTSLMLTSNNNMKKEEKINHLTIKFIEATDEVLKTLSVHSSGDFITEALQKFSSIMTSIETINYLKGNYIDGLAVAKNISTKLSDLIYTNYITIKRSFDVLPNKSKEDYVIFLREIDSYKETLIRAYELNNDNISALKRYAKIASNILDNSDKFGLGQSQYAIFKREFDKYTVELNEKDPTWEMSGKKAKKKGFFSKLLG